MSDPFIVPADDGWYPPDELIEEMRAAARAKGLISDWPHILVLTNHDFMLDCSHVTGDFGADLIATKRSGQWIFKTDREDWDPDGRSFRRRSDV